MIKKNLTKIIIIVLHTVGVFGLLSPYKELFIKLTPINIIISSILLFYNQKIYNKNFFIFTSTIFLLGYLVELIGVKTEMVFGSYRYGNTLGLKILDIPIIMGLNWINLIYSIGTIMNRINISNLSRSLIGAAILTFLDFFLETVAIHYDFWSWKNNTVPLQNYIAWFIFSFIFLQIFNNIQFEKTNKFTLLFIIVQFTFFISLSILI